MKAIRPPPTGARPRAPRRGADPYLGVASLAGLGILAGCGSGPPEDITSPEPLRDRVSVTYPMELWDREVQGETLLRVRIEKDGTVGEVTVTVSSGEAAFDSAAVRGARAARFEPARRGEDAIAVWATLPVVFSKRPG